MDMCKGVGLHGAEIARRGASKSYCYGALLTKLFVLGIDSEQTNHLKAIVYAASEEYLGDKEGTLSKFTLNLDFLRYGEVKDMGNNSPWVGNHKFLRESVSDHHWINKWKRPKSLSIEGNQNEVLGTVVADNPDVGRGKRTNFLFVDELGYFRSFLDF